MSRRVSLLKLKLAKGFTHIDPFAGSSVIIRRNDVDLGAELYLDLLVRDGFHDYFLCIQIALRRSFSLRLLSISRYLDLDSHPNSSVHTSDAQEAAEDECNYYHSDNDSEFHSMLSHFAVSVMLRPAGSANADPSGAITSMLATLPSLSHLAVAQVTEMLCRISTANGVAIAY